MKLIIFNLVLLLATSLASAKTISIDCQIKKSFEEESIQKSVSVSLNGTIEYNKGSKVLSADLNLTSIDTAAPTAEETIETITDKVTVKKLNLEGTNKESYVSSAIAVTFDQSTEGAISEIEFASMIGLHSFSFSAKDLNNPSICQIK